MATGGGRRGIGKGICRAITRIGCHGSLGLDATGAVKRDTYEVYTEVGGHLPKQCVGTTKMQICVTRLVIHHPGGDTAMRGAGV